MHLGSLWLLLVGGTQAVLGQWTPCPDVFQYEGTSGNEYGIITVPDPYPYLAIDITVEIYITARVPSVSYIICHEEIQGQSGPHCEVMLFS